MSSQLPASLLVLERGWLSANNILCFDGDQATLVDSGYVSHAEQTVDLVRDALQGRGLDRVLKSGSQQYGITPLAQQLVGLLSPLTVAGEQDAAGLLQSVQADYESQIGG